jgi:DNA-binding SARP family transcriptional activator
VGVRVLGSIELHGPQHEVKLGSAKERAVLAVLALDLEHGVSRDDLVDRAWGEEPPASRGTLDSLLSRLRGNLASAFDRDMSTFVVLKTGSYRLGVAPERVDLYRFRRLKGDADKAVASGDQQEATALLREAVTLWRGKPLGGVDGDWFARMRTSLEDERLDAITTLMDAELSAGRHHQIVAELRDLVARDPIEERFIGRLMLAHHRCGNQPAALACFADAQKRSREELGVDPSPALRKLHEQILRNDPALGGPPTPSPPAEPADPQPAEPWPPRGGEDELPTGGYRAEAAAGRLTSRHGYFRDWTERGKR